MDVVDSEALLEFTKDAKTILDIGSGAGLPGIIIAIHQPGTKVVMSEKNKKKAYFIKRTINQLNLNNAEILDYAISPKTNPGAFDVITARALGEINKIIYMSHHLLEFQGKFCLMKGTEERVNEELFDLDKKLYAYNVHKKSSKYTQRHIVEIYKK